MKCKLCSLGVSGACNWHRFFTEEQIEKMCDKEPDIIDLSGDDNR